MKSLFVTLTFILSFLAAAKDCPENQVLHSASGICMSQKESDNLDQRLDNCDNQSASKASTCKSDILSSIQQAQNEKLSSKDMKSNENKEAMMTIGTSIAGAIAVKTGLIPSKGCSISGKIGMGGAVVSIAASISNHKKAKKDMKSVKEKYEAELKKMEQDGFTYDTQVKVLTLMIEALTKMEQIAKRKKMKHMLVGAIYAAATAIAMFEIPMIPFNQNCSPMAQAALAAGTVWELLGMQKASKMMSDYKSRKEAVQKILNRLLESMSNMALDPTQLAETKNLDRYYGKVDKTDNIYHRLETYYPNSSREPESNGEPVCIEPSGGIDLKCGCSQEKVAGVVTSKNCYKGASRFPSLNKSAQAALQKSRFDSIQKTANDLTSGKVTIGDLNEKNLKNNFVLANKVKSFVEKKINEKLKESGSPQIEKLNGVDELNKLMGNLSEKDKSFAAKYNSSSLGMDKLVNEGIAKATESSKDPEIRTLSEVSISRPSDAAMAPIPSANDSRLGDIVFDEMEEEQQAMLRRQKKVQDEYEVDENQIIKDQEASLFDVIKNRYNVIRLKKRIGN